MELSKTKICFYYENYLSGNYCRHPEHYSLAEGRCEGGMFCPGYKQADSDSVREQVAQVIAANILARYQPVFPIDFYELADSIISIIEKGLREQGWKSPEELK